MDNKTYLDIIFQGFSKSYSAYWNRTHRSQRILISFLTSLLLFALVLYPLFPKEKPHKSNTNHLKVKQKKVVQYSQLSAPPPIDMVDVKPPKKKGVPKPQKVASKKFVKPTVKPDAEIEKEEFIPSQDELKYVNPGLKDEDGDSLQNVSLQGDGDGSGMEVQYDLSDVEVVEDEAPKTPVVEPKVEEVYEFVEKKASFPGGMKALYQYLGQHIEYPTIAKDNGISGRVIMQFVVERNGSISQIEVIRDIGGGCGEEAIRVLSTMPAWIPAEQNGLMVRSRFTLPISFKLENSKRQKS